MTQWQAASAGRVYRVGDKVMAAARPPMLAAT
jgi:hypothetical protein